MMIAVRGAPDTEDVHMGASARRPGESAIRTGQGFVRTGEETFKN